MGLLNMLGLSSHDWAQVSSPQVDLTRCGLDKTPTLSVLQCHPGGPLFQRALHVRKIVRLNQRWDTSAMFECFFLGSRWN